MADNSTPTLVAFDKADFIEMPAKTLHYRGISFSRSTLIRLWQANQIKTIGLRMTGKVKKRRAILRESLDTYLDDQLSAVE